MLKNRLTLWQVIGSLVLIQLMMWILLWVGPQLPPEIPLWYFYPHGAAQLAEPVNLWFLPGLAALSLAVNFFTALYFDSRQRHLAKLLLFSAFVFSFLASWALFLILLRVGVVQLATGLSWF